MIFLLHQLFIYFVFCLSIHKCFAKSLLAAVIHIVKFRDCIIIIDGNIDYKTTQIIRFRFKQPRHNLKCLGKI